MPHGRDNPLPFWSKCSPRPSGGSGWIGQCKWVVGPKHSLTRCGTLFHCVSDWLLYPQCILFQEVIKPPVSFEYDTYSLRRKCMWRYFTRAKINMTHTHIINGSFCLPSEEPTIDDDDDGYTHTSVVIWLCMVKILWAEREREQPDVEVDFSPGPSPMALNGIDIGWTAVVWHFISFVSMI